MAVGGIGDKLLTAVKDIIPESRLVTIGDFFVSEPVVSEGDDVYEINLTNNNLKPRNYYQMEPWMLPDTEIMFLKCIAGNDSSALEKFIAFAYRNHWFGGKCIFLDLDKGKTIVNRQTKFVLHNFNPQNLLNHKIPYSLEKTNFALEEWPYSSVNKLLLSDDNDYLAPWMRSKNKKLNAHHSTLNNMPTISVLKTVALTTPKNVSFLQHQQKQQPQIQLQQHQQRDNTFYSVPYQQIFLHSRQTPMMSFLPNFVCHEWPVNLPTTYVMRPPTSVHILSNVQSSRITSSSSTTAAISRDQNRDEYIGDASHSTLLKKCEVYKEKNDGVMLQSENDLRKLSTDVRYFDNDRCVETITSTFETNNKERLNKFMIFLKHIYPRRLEQFSRILSTMDYLNSQPFICFANENCNT